MKYLIASDIHGAADCCSLLLERFREEKADKLLLLGDLLYHGPRNALPADYDTPSVAKQLNAMAAEILCVRGNCDAEVDQMVLDFPIQADYLMLQEGPSLIFATHGHLYDPGRPPALAGVDVLLTGHTHTPACELRKGFLYINPGSVSMPKGGSCRSYMTMENGHLAWHALDGTVYMEHQLDYLGEK